MELRKAEKQKTKLRIGASGPSGSGKTYSMLKLARGLVNNWNEIVIIDTENGSADLYAGMGDFNVLPLDAPYTPERYIEAINTCNQAGFKVIIIDSVSHEWEGKGGCLEVNELLGQTKYKGNTWAAWNETKPRHRKFIDAILTSPAHIITTARSKTDTIQTEDRKVKKIGLREIQMEGYEYELTLNFTIDMEKHMAVASKDRTSLFIDKDPFLITEETGKTLLNWALSGSEVKVPTSVQKELEKGSFESLAKEIDGGMEELSKDVETPVKKVTNYPINKKVIKTNEDAKEAVSQLQKPVCSYEGCGVEISDAINKYSMEHLGKPYCMKHQAIILKERQNK